MINKYSVIGFVVLLPRLERGMEVITVQEAYPLCLRHIENVSPHGARIQNREGHFKQPLHTLLENLYKNLHKHKGLVHLLFNQKL